MIGRLIGRDGPKHVPKIWVSQFVSTFSDVVDGVAEERRHSDWHGRRPQESVRWRNEEISVRSIRE